MPALYRYTVTLICFLSLLVGGALAEDSRTGRASNERARAYSPGFRAYLDPATGKLIDHPPYGKAALEMSPEALRRFSTSDFGLIERVLPNGMRIVDLQGRFRQGSVATVNAEGGIEVHRFGGDIFSSPTGRAIRKSLDSDEFIKLTEGADGE